MYVYIYLYIYTCICICIHMCMYTYMYISFLSLLGIEILMEKYPTTVSLSGYPNVAIPCSVFLAN